MLENNSGGNVDAALLRLAKVVQETGYVFTTPTPATHGRVNARPGAEVARDLRDVFGWSRPFVAGVMRDHMLEAMREAGVLGEEGALYRSRVRFSTLDGLLFVHSAHPTTQPDSVFFGPDTYRFARAIRAQPLADIGRAVDIGCGAGLGAILVARAQPRAQTFAVDINESALRMTRVNAALAGATITAVKSNLLHDLPGQFDLIVANPPYLNDPAERAYRHGGGKLGAGLSLKILDAAIERLAPSGTLLLYTGAAIVDGNDPFHKAASARLHDAGFAWTYEEIDPDVFGEELETGAYANTDRIAAVLLTLSKRG